MHIKKRDQEGSIFIEATVVLSILALMLGGGFEFYRYFLTYMNLSHSAREVALVGASVKNLSGTSLNLDVSEGEYTACYYENQSIPGSDCGQKILQWTALKMIKSQPYYYKEGTLKVTTSLDAGTPESVQIKIEADYDGVFPFFKDLKLTTVEKSIKIGKG